MEPERASEIRRWISIWQAKLGLSHWDIRLIDREPDPDESASVAIWALNHIAVVRVGPGVPPHGLERTVVHELLHIVLRPLEFWGAETREYVPGPLHSFLERTERDEREVAIEKLTHALTHTAYIADRGNGELYEEAFP